MTLALLLGDVDGLLEAVEQKQDAARSVVRPAHSPTSEVAIEQPRDRSMLACSGADSRRAMRHVGLGNDTSCECPAHGSLDMLHTRVGRFLEEPARKSP